MNEIKSITLLNESKFSKIQLERFIKPVKTMYNVLIKHSFLWVFNNFYKKSIKNKVVNLIVF